MYEAFILGAVSVISKPSQDVKIVDEQNFLRTFEDTKTLSGRTLLRQFCGNCGSTLFNMRPGKNLMTVASGAVEDTSGWFPNREFFYNNRREWLPEVPGTHRSATGFQPADKT